MKTLLETAVLGLALVGLCHANVAAAEVKAAVQAKARELAWIGTDPVVVNAVREHNAHPSAEARAMTNEAWRKLTVLDTFVRSLSKNAVVQHLREQDDPTISELFVSGADGTKVAFFAKPSSWSHKGMEKHEVPMTGEIWLGRAEVDDSTGIEQIQVGMPVVDGKIVIGSVVIGLALYQLAADDDPASPDPAAPAPAAPRGDGR